jgi:hypothetical protein
MVNSSGDGPGLSSGFGKVNGCSLLHPQHGLALMHFGQLGIVGCRVTDDILLTMGGLQLGVNNGWPTKSPMTSS